MWQLVIAVPLRVLIPDRYPVGHEAHFGEVTQQFLACLEHPDQMPAWEMPNMLAKYFVTTQGVHVSTIPTAGLV